MKKDQIFLVLKKGLFNILLLLYPGYKVKTDKSIVNLQFCMLIIKLYTNYSEAGIQLINESQVGGKIDFLFKIGA